MIFTGRSVDALDQVRGAGDIQPDGASGRRDMSAGAVAIAAGWFSSLRRPGKRKKNYQKQAKSAWDLSVLSVTTVSHVGYPRRPRILRILRILQLDYLVKIPEPTRPRKTTVFLQGQLADSSDLFLDLSYQPRALCVVERYFE